LNSFCCSHQVYELYPNKFLKLDESRVYVLNTLFNLPETVVLSGEYLLISCYNFS